MFEGEDFSRAKRGLESGYGIWCGGIYIENGFHLDRDFAGSDDRKWSISHICAKAFTKRFHFLLQKHDQLSCLTASAK